MNLSKLSRTICCAVAGATLFAAAMPTSEACFTMAAGKDATASGKVILAHNEDDGGRIAFTQHKVPRMTHPKGTMMTFEGSNAKIPQVSETLAYYWSESRDKAGVSFADAFVNERGVAIVSNSCADSREDKADITGGIGFGIRQIVAERATSARNAVEIATKFIDTYGYNSSGRTYTFADKDESWMLQVVKGKHYVAKRIADNEIALIPNHYTVRQVDLSDKKNVIASPDLITYAIERNWYAPKRTGDYSDFDFARAYQKPSGYEGKGSSLRHQYGVEILTQTPYTGKQFPFSVVLDKKVTKDDLKAVLSSHYEGTRDDLSSADVSPHYSDRRVICTGTTQESSIIEFNDNANLNIIWRAYGRPCIDPFVPLVFGMSNMPAAAELTDGKTASATHFKTSPADYSYDPNSTYWIFQDMQNIVDPQYLDKAPAVIKQMKAIEKSFEREVPGMIAKADKLYRQNPTAAEAYVTKYTADSLQKASDAAKKVYNDLAVTKINITQDTIAKSLKNQMVEVTVFGSNTLNVKNIDAPTLKLSAAYTRPVEDRTNVAETKYADVDSDGKLDLIATFPADKVLKNISPCYADIWLQGNLKDGKRIVAKDCVTVTE